MKFSKTTLRLAGTYLAIIMIMSIGFSLVLYQVSMSQLERQQVPKQTQNQVAPQQEFHFADPAVSNSVNDFLVQRANEARGVLVVRLVLLNAIALVVGSLLSYLLAERTLRPIRANMKAQSQFVSDASHELRTPLTALRTANEVALRSKKLTVAQARSVIEGNVKDVTRLQTLTDNMLGLLKDDQSVKVLQPTQLQSVVGDAMNLVVTPAQAKQIAIDDQTPPVSVTANASRLTQLLTILLDNAIKYSPANTTVVINATTKAKWVHVNIIDQGVGMDADTRSKIFRRFYRADQSRTGGDTQGYGLGLAIAHKIVTEHGGKITVESAPGKGTTFTVSLRMA